MQPMITRKTPQDNVLAFSRRLNTAIDDTREFPVKGKARQKKVGAALGVSQQAARKWLEAEGMPRTARIPLIAERLGVCAAWLLSGEGPQHHPGTYREAPEPAPTELEMLADALQEGRLSRAEFARLVRAILAPQVDRE